MIEAFTAMSATLDSLWKAAGDGGPQNTQAPAGQQNFGDSAATSQMGRDAAAGAEAQKAAWNKENTRMRSNGYMPPGFSPQGSILDNARRTHPQAEYAGGIIGDKIAGNLLQPRTSMAGGAFSMYGFNK